MPRRLAALLALALAAPALAADAKFTIKADTAPPPKELKEPFRELLGDQVVRLLDDKGATLMTVWLSKELPSKATPEQVKNGLTYRELRQTSVVGAVQLAQVWTDYRKQKIQPGVYTLRLAWQPQDGDHMGTAPYNEFCLLTPADKDEKPATMEAKALHELSANSTGGSHPSVLLLFPNPKPQAEPELVAMPNDTWVLHVKRPVVADTENTVIGLGLALAGHTTSE